MIKKPKKKQTHRIFLSKSLFKLAATILLAIFFIVSQTNLLGAFESSVINVLATITYTLPKINPPDGKICAPQTGTPDQVTITAPPLAGAELVYTLDGSEPDCVTHAHHSSPTTFGITGPQTVKTRACYDSSQSPIVSLYVNLVDCTGGYCGDGSLDPGEECDDGNNIDGDGCSASCQTEIQPQPGDVVINEFLPNPDGLDNAPMPDGEWVELYNRGGTQVDVAGWVLYDSYDTHELYITASSTHTGNTLVAPGGFLVVYRDGDGDFALNNSGGDSVRLFDGYPPAGSNLIDSYTYTTDAASGKSYARIPDGVDNWVDPIPTPGAPNKLTEESLLNIFNIQPGTLILILEPLKQEQKLLLESPTENPTPALEQPTSEELLIAEEDYPDETLNHLPVNEDKHSDQISSDSPDSNQSPVDEPPTEEPAQEPTLEENPVQEPIIEEPTQQIPQEELSTEELPAEEPSPDLNPQPSSEPVEPVPSVSPADKEPVEEPIEESSSAEATQGMPEPTPEPEPIKEPQPEPVIKEESEPEPETIPDSTDPTTE